MALSIPNRAIWSVLFVVSVLAPQAADAHCDTLDGPVVSAAKTALERGDLTPVLKVGAREGRA